jgi:transcription factor MYB, plant
VTGNGSSSREKSKGAIKRVNHPVPKQDDNSMAITAVTGPSDDDEIVDAQPLQVSRDMPHIPGPGPKRSIVKFGPYFFWLNMVFI